MEEPSRKRARDDSGQSSHDVPGVAQSESVQATGVCIRDIEFWLDDGNIILNSRNVSFKVYKGMLAEHSDVFKSMYQIAQGVQAPSEQQDGCPVVQLDDSPDDLRELFRLIFPRHHGLKLTKNNIDIEVLSAIIRLDHKYELTDLYAQATGYLSEYYTSNYDAWASETNASRWEPEPIHAISAIALARLTNTPSILPTAFYVCATLSPSEIMEGYTRRDGVIERLSKEDMKRCLNLRDRLVNAHTVITLTLFKAPSKTCTARHSAMSNRMPSVTGCAAFLGALLERCTLGSFSRTLTSPGALMSWVPCIEYYSSLATLREIGLRTALCAECKTHFEENDEQKRRAVWNELPRLIGITVNGWGASDVRA
ncbi:hypothetical protein C8Q78DRAFT_978943 [Trametes maxima]|nr:hypothetical protein C8Q78DRAFT_978943 [Trametes maxima]